MCMNDMNLFRESAKFKKLRRFVTSLHFRVVQNYREAVMACNYLNGDCRPLLNSCFHSAPLYSFLTSILFLLFTLFPKKERERHRYCLTLNYTTMHCYLYKNATEAKSISRKSSAGKSLWHKRIQYGYTTMNGEGLSWMQETLLG